MNINRSYNQLVGLLPIIYLIHNAEEWLIFRLKVSEIIRIVPEGLKGFIGNDQHFIIAVFGIAIIVATIIPLVVALIIWNKPSKLNVNILLVAGFITLINGISHISSSLLLGKTSPGFITGIALCIPYGVVTFEFIRRKFQSMKVRFILLGLLSLCLFVVGLAAIWGLAYLAISII